MPSNDATHELVRRIHASPERAVISVTGGGSLAISRLLCVPGASQTVLEARVPYSAAALCDWLGLMPEQACSSATARAMAMAGYRRAEFLASRERERPESRGTAVFASHPSPPAPLPQGERGDGAFPVVGLGLTAGLASDRPKRGAHRIHLAAQSASCTWSQSIELAKGTRSRDEEELLAAALLLELFAEVCGLQHRPEVVLRDDETLERRRTDAPQAWQELMAGKCDRIPARAESAAASAAAVGIFPGSFNPLHDGHRRMQALAEARLGGPVHYEISIENVGKLPLDFEDMANRSRQLTAELDFTRAPRMVQKARLYPGRTIVCGLDTITRVADVRFAEGSEAQRDQTIAEIAALGCRFLVFGRATPQGFQTLDDLDLPPALRAVSECVTEAEFREDVSSTALRRQED